MWPFSLPFESIPYLSLVAICYWVLNREYKYVTFHELLITLAALWRPVQIDTNFDIYFAFILNSDGGILM